MKPNRKEGGVYRPIAVVSGADRNIGLEIVKQFLQRGWKVFAGRYLMELPLLEELQEKYPQQLTLVPLDVSYEESVDAAAKIVAEKADYVDLLVHNAAVFGGGRDENGCASSPRRQVRSALRTERIFPATVCPRPR